MNSQKIKYIFCINTGRSGSRYLNTLFSHAENCHVEHHALPIGYGQAMRDYFFGKTELIRQVTEEKVEKIKKIKTESNIYIETNHCFIKGFGWLIPEYIPQEEIGVVVLTRDPQKIIDSTLRIECGPLVNKGRQWILTPDLKNCHIEPPNWFLSPKVTYELFRFLKRPFESDKKLYDWLNLRSPQLKNLVTKYERESVQWYIDETTALGEAYQKQFPKIKYFSVDVEPLNNFAKVKELFDYFGLIPKPTIQEAVGEPVNLKLWYNETKK
ncbi:MAG: hypothetical protein AB4063_23125 [Crocosphaera sp.]